MALTKKGTLAFGIGSGGITDPLITGIASTSSIEVSSEFTTNVNAKDPSGEVSAHVYGNQKNSGKVEGYVTAGTLPALGTSLTLAGKSMAVMNASITGSNEDFVKVSVSCEGFNNITY